MMMNKQDRFEAPYYDYLQAPLQPLMDNLESQTVSLHVPACVATPTRQRGSPNRPRSAHR